MKKYKTTGLIKLFAGKIGLSDDQAACRKHAVKKSGDAYDITAPVQFKAGEVIYLDKPAKVTIENLVCLDDPKPVQKAKPGPKPKKAIK